MAVTADDGEEGDELAKLERQLALAEEKLKRETRRALVREQEAREREHERARIQASKREMKESSRKRGLWCGAHTHTFLWRSVVDARPPSAHTISSRLLDRSALKTSKDLREIA